MFDLSIILPTFNESKNIGIIVNRLEESLKGISWEAIFVDDNSPDETYEIVKNIARNNNRVRCIRRIGRRGLAGACIEGILSSSSPFVAVMDSDLQHDETLLPIMLGKLIEGWDLAIGSRYIEGGSSLCGFNKTRQIGSSLATDLAKRLLKVEVLDPMSGFFMIRRSKFEEIAPHLSNDGFKLLLDLLTQLKNCKIIEIPFKFRNRVHGDSKLDALVTLDYLGLLINKISKGLVPLRFFLFCLTGGSGVLVHVISLVIFSKYLNIEFLKAQSISTAIAMTWNYYINNNLTFRDRRKSGVKFFKGLLVFYMICSLGAIANIGIGTWIYENNHQAIISGLVGALIGAVFNYLISSAILWKTK